MIKQYLYRVKKRPLQYFFLKLFTLVIIIFITDNILGSILRYYYFKQRNGESYRITYALEKTHEDILIFGSSRANHHYHPAIFENRLHLSCYNTGIDGEHIFYQYAILEGVFKRYTPKLLIFDFIATEFIKDRESYDRLAMLLPYYSSHAEIRSIIELKSPYEKYKLFSKIYPYNSLIFPIALGNTDYKKSKKEDINGYLPLTQVWDEPIQTRNYPENYTIDRNKVNVFESIIKECIRHGTKVYFICSPYYFKTENQDKSIQMGREIAKKYNIDFIDFSNDDHFRKNRSLFADFSHLNDFGARIFSTTVIDTLEKISHTKTARLTFR